MKKCYKDKERLCDDECAAFVEQDQGANCLELASLADVSKYLRLATDSAVKAVKTSAVSRDINSFYMKLMVEALQSLGSDLKGILKF